MERLVWKGAEVLLFGAGRGTALWLSRHEPLEAELEELEKRFGVGALLLVKKRVATLREAKALIALYRPKIVVAVMPAGWILKLAARGAPVVVPVFARVRACTERPTLGENERRECVVERDGKMWLVKRFVAFAPIYEATGAAPATTPRWTRTRPALPLRPSQPARGRGTR